MAKAPAGLTRNKVDELTRNKVDTVGMGGGGEVAKYCTYSGVIGFLILFHDEL